MIKIFIIRLIPLAVMLAAIYLFVEPKERPILLCAALGMSLIWACMVYSFSFGAGALIWLKRKIFGYKKDLYN